MNEGLDLLVQAFSRMEQRLVVSDRGVREAINRWSLSTEIPVKEIIGALEKYENLKSSETVLKVPLHEEETAELTGEFVEYRIDQPLPSIVYYEFDRGRRSRLGLDKFGKSYLGWRVRFWHPDYEPPEPPSFVSEGFQRPRAPDSISEESVVTPATDQNQDLFTDLRDFVVKQRQAERTETRKAFKRMQFRAFSKAYGAVQEAIPTGRDYDEELGQVCRLKIPSEKFPEENGTIPDAFDLYPGMTVLVTTRKRHQGFPITAKIESIDGPEIALGVYWDSSNSKAEAERAFQSDSEATFTIAQLLNPVPYDRQANAISAVEENPRKRGVIEGSHGVTFNSAESVTLSPRDLNKYQQGAVRRCLLTSSIYCIHGPPGTGKTRTLRALIRALVERNNRVLAAAHSNQAIDNLLFGESTRDRPDPDSLHADAEAGNFTVSRVGTNSTHPLMDEVYEEIPAWKGDVVGATTSGAADFRENEFDVAVIDEASQATIPSSLIPYVKAEKLILAGDHKQLPPYTSSELADEENMEISLFEHLIGCYGDEIKSTLRKQYRMHQRIAAFPNKQFYGGELLNAERNRRWTIRDLPPLKAIDVAGQEKETPSGSYYNKEEVRYVQEEVGDLLDKGVRASDIGVITPYSGQAGKINVALEDTTREADKIQVSTVDAFQGSERDAIVISFVRSNEDNRTGFLTFPKEGPRRLNVALTRARKRCVLIGDWSTLTGPRTGSRIGGIEHYRGLKSHLEKKGLLKTSVRR